MPKVSIVTPSYNHNRFLCDRVSSILNQTYRDFEWIIIDDCSTDDSQETLERLTAGDDRVKVYFHEVNQGMPKTVQQAIDRSTGNFIYRAESDDVCHPRFLERMVQVLEAAPHVGFVFCSSLYIDELGSKWGGGRRVKQDFLASGSEFFQRLIKENVVPGCNFVFTRKVHDQIGGFDTGKFKVACDYHFCLRACLMGDVGYISEPLGYHRIHTSNLSKKIGKSFDIDLLMRESYGLLQDVFDRIPEEQSHLRKLKEEAFLTATKNSGASFYIRALLGQQWSNARKTIDYINQYQPGITKTLWWYLACLQKLAFFYGYEKIYTPLAKNLRIQK